ncbi:MAG: class I SAM-dependent DNA methyltransferase [Caldilineaceae bacterium]|nr:class I SAM-dependent DNA methyltransferase [Caldilineaceae bacterium]
MTPQEFVAKWRDVTLKERAAAQEHFIDLCRLIGHPTPAEDDPTGDRFTFEAGVDKQGGGQGWADVWKRDYFAWEYKGKHANLKRAYEQLLQYRESLLNPPLLVVSDIDSIVVHTNFTNTVKRVITVTLDDLLAPDGLRNLRAIFTEPEHFRSQQTTAQVTKEAAEEFALLADNLRKHYESSEEIAHYLIRVLFCLFAEDIELLPRGLFTRLVDYGRRNPDNFTPAVGQLFQAMSTGGLFGVDPIRYFDGGLFDGGDALSLNRDGLTILHRVAQLDWSSIEPSIFGTLFQRSLDPSKRSQLGAHYTDREDILLIVEPVLMAPLRREWEVVKTRAVDTANRRDSASTQSVRTRLNNELGQVIGGFLERLSTVRVLDPACGSGNFLYVALRMLLDLWKEVSNFAGTLGLPLMLTTNAPSPEQLFGIEIDAYAHELAQATVWIGYIQWLHENGYGIPREPILRKLDNIKHMDAILAYDAEGKPVEPEWPKAEVIIGNPPFLGDKKMRSELGDSYVDDLRSLYDSNIPGGVDLVVYWFERSRLFATTNQTVRAGLLATNSIRNGANQTVLQNIKQSGDIFMAWSDRPWILDGAAVRVSMIGFDGGVEITRMLDGQGVDIINADLTTKADLTTARPLQENANICFLGMMKAGPFDIDNSVAQEMLAAPVNPNGRYNSDVIKIRFAGRDVTGRPRYGRIIDFGVDRTDTEAALYEMPFEYIKQHVKPLRDVNRRLSLKERWWIYGEARRGLRAAIKKLERMIVTPEVAKHRLFIWLPTSVIPDHKLHVFARQDDYFLGVLHSTIHEAWSLALGSTLEDRPSYSSSRTFGTFAFPWPPGQEPTDDPIVQAIAQAAEELVEKRDAWLNPPGLDKTELKKRTLTNLYNARPTWLDLAHKKLDAAVLAAYGWSDLMTDEGITDEEELLSRLLALNLERAANQSDLQPSLIAEDAEDE